MWIGDGGMAIGLGWVGLGLIFLHCSRILQGLALAISVALTSRVAQRSATNTKARTLDGARSKVAELYITRAAAAAPWTHDAQAMLF